MGTLGARRFGGLWQVSMCEKMTQTTPVIELAACLRRGLVVDALKMMNSVTQAQQHVQYSRTERINRQVFVQTAASHEDKAFVGIIRAHLVLSADHPFVLGLRNALCNPDWHFMILARDSRCRLGWTAAVQHWTASLNQGGLAGATSLNQGGLAGATSMLEVELVIRHLASTTLAMQFVIATASLHFDVMQAVGLEGLAYAERVFILRMKDDELQKNAVVLQAELLVCGLLSAALGGEECWGCDVFACVSSVELGDTAVQRRLCWLD